MAPALPRPDAPRPSVAVEAADTTLDYITGIGQVVATVIAVVVAYIAVRSARAAERTAEAQTRPLLIDVPGRYPVEEYEIPLGDGTTQVSAKAGEVLVFPDAGRFSLPLRNAGRGAARVVEVEVELPGGRLVVARFTGGAGGPRTVVSKEYVPPGEETRISPTVYDDRFQAQLRSEARGAVFNVRVTYTDLAGGQRQRVGARVGKPLGGGPWTVLSLVYPRPRGPLLKRLLRRGRRYRPV